MNVSGHLTVTSTDYNKLSSVIRASDRLLVHCRPRVPESIVSFARLFHLVSHSLSPSIKEAVERSSEEPEKGRGLEGVETKGLGEEPGLLERLEQSCSGFAPTEGAQSCPPVCLSRAAESPAGC